jgi:hypothetical protein
LEPTRIFVSYRREDSSGWVGRLVDDLSRRFGAENVFQDIHSIRPGADFLDAITATLRQADCILVVIGPVWLGAKDETGGRRLDDENDYVRLELATALRGGSRVIPVLVGGARMPAPLLLPEDIRALARRNAAELSDSRWSYDLDQLVQTIAAGSELRQPPPKNNPAPPRPVSHIAPVLGFLAFVVAGAATLYWWFSPSPAPIPPPVAGPANKAGTPAASTVPATGAVIVFGSDDTFKEAQDEVKKALNAGFSSAKVYRQRGKYVSVIEFPTRENASADLRRVRSMAGTMLSKWAADATVNNLSNFCPNGVRRSAPQEPDFWDCL